MADEAAQLLPGTARWNRIILLARLPFVRLGDERWAQLQGRCSAWMGCSQAAVPQAQTGARAVNDSWWREKPMAGPQLWHLTTFVSTKSSNKVKRQTAAVKSSHKRPSRLQQGGHVHRGSLKCGSEAFFCGPWAPPDPVIEILPSSAFCATQKWDVSLPQQSVSVTSLTPGWDSGHFLSLAAFPLHLFHPLIIWYPDGAFTGEKSLAV